MEVAVIIFFVGALVFVAHLFAGIFSRTKIPDVLLLIIIGLCVGPLLHIVKPSHFGVVGPVFTTVALVVILFEGGLELHIDELRKAVRGTLTLTMLSFLVTMFAVAFMTMWLTDLNPTLCFVLGAIVGSTSPAIIIPLIRQLQMHKQSQTLLFLESAISDVISIIIALGLLQAYELGEIRFGNMMGQMMSSFLVAALLGIVSGFLWSVLLNKVRTLQNAIFTTPAFVFVVFGITEMFGYSGYISSLAFGITLGNIELFDLSFLKKYVPHEPIGLSETERVFFSEVVFLLKTFFFVYIGLYIQLSDLWSIHFGLIVTLLIFILRIPVVWIAVHKSTPVDDASLMAVMVPKGLAAAVLASLPFQLGISGGEIIQNVTYAVVLFSIFLTSLLILFLGKTRLSKLYGWIFSRFGSYVEPSSRSQASSDETHQKSDSDILF